MGQESDDLISVGLEERLLLAIWRCGGSRRRGGCAMGTSELAEEIGYSRDERGKVSGVLGKLREEGYFREKGCGGDLCRKLTPRGLRRILPFAIGRYLAAFLALLGASLLGVGILWWVRGMPVPPWFAIATGAVSAVLAAFSWVIGDRYEGLVLRSKRPSPRRRIRFTGGERRVHLG
ncbi:MAG: hypothetical protein ACP5LG_05045 [Conexivisphaera sp.]